jgi:hypothetical protein
LVATQFFLLSQGVKKTLRLIGQEEAVSQNIKPRNKREIATRIMTAAAGNSAEGVSVAKRSQTIFSNRVVEVSAEE